MTSLLQLAGEDSISTYSPCTQTEVNSHCSSAYEQARKIRAKQQEAIARTRTIQQQIDIVKGRPGSASRELSKLYAISEWLNSRELSASTVTFYMLKQMV